MLFAKLLHMLFAIKTPEKYLLEIILGFHEHSLMQKKFHKPVSLGRKEKNTQKTT
jgi:hypothetical protein